MCQIPIKMLKQHPAPNSSLQNLKIYSSKGSRKTNQSWIMYIANITNLKLRFSAENTTLDYGFLLRLANAFTVNAVTKGVLSNVLQVN